jgi:hypothetical protein
MERWLKAPEAVAADPVKETAQLAAAKAEMGKVWDATANRDEMLKKIEAWLVATASVEVRGCVPREKLYPLMVEVYQEKHPEDFEAVKPAPVGEVEP